MAIAELVREVKLAPQCYFCEKPVGEGDYCYGCRQYICGSCNEIECVGDHAPEDHKINWEVDEDD